MSSMYNTIMDLPIFKGISRDQVSSFLEKTTVSFRTYSKGEIVFRPGDLCRDIRYLISGNLMITHSHFSGKVIVRESLAQGTVIGADRLFGLNTRMCARAECKGRVDIMWFSKEQFLQLLRSDDIYQINFLNYLSLRAQKAADLLNDFSSGSLLAYLGFWVSVFTERGSTGIEMDVTPKNLSLLTGISVEELSTQLAYIRKEGLASYSKMKSCIRIESREALIEAAFE